MTIYSPGSRCPSSPETPLLEVPGVASGDFVVAPFTYCDGTCAHCRAGVTSQCVAGGSFGNHGIDGGQGEAVRVPLASSTLVLVPGSGHSDETMRSLLTLSGGATDIIAERGDTATEAILELTRGVGVDAALECVGTGESVATALAIARPGSTVGVVGAPHGVEVPIIDAIVYRNIGLRGGIAPARIYIPELLDDVLYGRINPGRVFDFETDLEGIVEAYDAMDERRAIKSLLRVGMV